MGNSKGECGILRFAQNDKASWRNGKQAGEMTASGE
jgi:hypothetical protein